MSGGRVLEVRNAASAGPAVEPGVLLVLLDSHAGGISVERPGDSELVRLGYPETSDYQALRPVGDVSEKPNLVSEALAELIAARGVRELRFRDRALWPTLRKACRGRDVRIRYGETELAPSEARPVWDGMPAP
ncbi:MAG: hypothetical protein SF028_03460 [Candidatus Sumerlaeia bacterium]|nr:hypothetical protein [Candidatus Sumerlaeia bacterium]